MSTTSVPWGVPAAATAARPNDTTFRGTGYMTMVFGILIGVLGFLLIMKACQYIFTKTAADQGQDEEQGDGSGAGQQGGGAGDQRAAAAQGAQKVVKGFSPESISLLGETVKVGSEGDVSNAEQGGEAVECVICLTDFAEGQLLRKLHACTHSFHQECVDAWLTSHDVCPLCRTMLEPNPKDETAGDSNSNSNSGPVSDGSLRPVLIQTVQIVL